MIRSGTPCTPTRTEESWRAITDDMNGITHRIRVVNWNPKDKREQLLVASFDGVILYSASGKGDNLK